MAFIKSNSTAYPDALIMEARGLQLLQQTVDRQPDNPLRVPEVISVSERQLAITGIESQPGTDGQYRLLGRGLALLHREKQSRYGLEENNYIGLNPQDNTPSSNWGDFFIRRRLRYQISRIKNSGIRQHFSRILDRRSESLESFLNEHCRQPSLVHGDLWHGNILFDQQSVWLIDPAVYCGDREVDLAMTEMFGGFNQCFYAGYDEVYRRSEAYPLKRDIYNLYHYLNHYNLFGDSYLAGCEQGWRVIEQL